MNTHLTLSLLGCVLLLHVSLGALLPPQDLLNHHQEGSEAHCKDLKQRVVLLWVQRPQVIEAKTESSETLVALGVCTKLE